MGISLEEQLSRIVERNSRAAQLSGFGKVKFKNKDLSVERNPENIFSLIPYLLSICVSPSLSK